MKGRWKYQGIDGEKRQKDADGGKLSIQFDETTLKPIGANNSVWTHDLSLYEKQLLPLQVESYHKIEDECKKPIGTPWMWESVKTFYLIVKNNSVMVLLTFFLNNKIKSFHWFFHIHGFQIGFLHSSSIL